MRRREVIIVQRRLTDYRVPLFKMMRKYLADSDIDLRVLHGEGTLIERGKKDSGNLRWAEQCSTHYLLGDRICWQNYYKQTAHADLVIVTQENRLIYNLLALTAARPRRIAFWGHGRNMQSQSPDGIKERFKRLTVDKVDWWFAYTDLTRRYLIERGFSEDRISVLNNAIDTTDLANLFGEITDDDKARVRAKMRIGTEPVGVFVGSLYSEKRLSFLVAVAQTIREHIPDFVLLIIGDGPDRQLVELASKQFPWIRALGRQDGRAKLEFLAIADIMLNPGLVGLGILDAFVCGLPIVTTDCGLHSPEISYLSESGNGIMTENTEEAYVKAVVSLLSDEALLTHLQEGARDSAKYYSIEAMADRFCGGIINCLSSS